MNEIYLIKVDPNANNNKFYRMMSDEGRDSFTVCYGRVGSAGQTAEYPIGAWQKKYNEKIKKGYVDETELHLKKKIEHTVMGFSDISDANIQNLIDRLQCYAKDVIDRKSVV